LEQWRDNAGSSACWHADENNVILSHSKQQQFRFASMYLLGLSSWMVLLVSPNVQLHSDFGDIWQFLEELLSTL
jgi:hypothetical protein